MHAPMDSFFRPYYSNFPLKYAPVQVRITVKYAFFGKKIRVQDLLVEHVVNCHLV